MNNYTGMANQRADRERRTDEAWAQREANLFRTTGFYANQPINPVHAATLADQLFQMAAATARAQAESIKQETSK